MPTPPRIRFGTDGWRGVIARDFTVEGVRLVARAVAATLRAGHTEGGRCLVAIGHDTRFLSRRFAQAAADVVSALDVDTCLTDRKSTRLNSSHHSISYAVFCLK